jgi:hypothetical protein
MVDRGQGRRGRIATEDTESTEDERKNPMENFK